MFGLFILFVFALIHQALKFLRLRSLDWKPDVDSAKLPINIKLPINLIEREMAPSLMVLTFMISVGAYYVFAILMTLGIIACFVALNLSYKSMNQHRITIARIVLVVTTCFMFLSLLGDDHAFEDATLPQIIEDHMTELARLRHGDRSIDANGDEIDN